MIKKAILASLIFYLFPLFLTGDVLFLGPDSFSYDGFICIYPSFSDAFDVDSYFYAPIQLPEGSKITSMVIFYKDSDTNVHFKVKIVRRNRYSDSTQDIIPYWTSTDSGEIYRITKVTNVNWNYNKILNNACTYHVVVEFLRDSMAPAGDTILYGVKIFYKLPTT